MHFASDCFLLAAEDMSAYEIGQLGGILFWGVLLVLGMMKCRTIAQRPEANAKIFYGLAMTLLSMLGFMLVGWLKPQLDSQRLTDLGGEAMFYVFALGGAYALMGLFEIYHAPRGRYKQGLWQGVTVLALSAVGVGIVGWGFVSGLAGRKAVPDPYKVEQKPKGSAYAYKEFDFQVSTLPPEWTEVNAKKVNPLACASFMRSNPQIFMMVIVETVDPESDLNCDLLADAVKTTMIKKAGREIPFETSERAVAGVVGKALKFQAGMGNSAFDYINWVGYRPGFAYQILFWKVAGAPGSLQAESDNFLKNIKFLTPAKVAEAEEDPAGNEPPEKPLPPFALKAPAMEKTLGKFDLSVMDADDLDVTARRLGRSGKYSEAIQVQQWVVQKTKTGRYSLACYCGRANQADAALYYLQEAGVYEGCDPEWLAKDADFKTVKTDSRWPKIMTYMRASARYWRANVKVQVPVVTPTGYVVGTPIPVAIGLHGLGDTGDNFVGPSYQWLADDLGIAIIGVSGTNANGPGSFSWSEDTEKDRQHVLKALESVHDKVTVKSGQIALFGFSQGAQRALEFSAVDPLHFRGAVVMSPGFRGPPITVRPHTEENKSQRFFIMAGDGEHPQTLRSARGDHAWAQSAGAQSQLIIYEKMNTHTFPPDYNERIGPWLRDILQLPLPPAARKRTTGNG